MTFSTKGRCRIFLNAFPATITIPMAIYDDRSMVALTDEFKLYAYPFLRYVATSNIKIHTIYQNVVLLGVACTMYCLLWYEKCICKVAYNNLKINISSA